MIVTNVTKEVPIPHEPGEAVTIRRLSHTQLRAAAKKRQSEVTSWMKELGGELVRALQDGNAEKAKQIEEQAQKLEEAAAEKVDYYDRDALLEAGLVAWTYPEPVSAAAALDEETAAFIAGAIFEFARRRTPAEAKNA